VGYCVSCAKESETGKFCATCGRQLLTSKELAGDSTVVEEKVQVTKGNANLAMWAHLAPILGALVAIFLIVVAFVLWLPGLLVRNSNNATEFEKRHGTESMNFQLTILLFSVVGIIFSFVTLGIGLVVVIPAAIALGIASLIFTIMGTVAANEGRPYRYPLSIRFVK
jgi:uncharacterized Tic20 family protein